MIIKAGQTLINCSYNVVCRKIQKPVLLRLRLAASEKPVLNAPAFACIAKPKEGARTWNRRHGAKSSNSVARIEDGVLHIEQGPLVGQEARVKKIDRHKRWCLVDVGEGDSTFRELLPLDVPSKT